MFRDGPFRFFFFFSRQEERPHIHVHSADGEAKFWIEPARNHELVIDHEQEIRDAWHRHFDS